MNKRSYFKKHLFKAYEEIYAPTKVIGKLDLCRKCHGVPCEKGPDVVVLLPFESQFILNKLREKGLKYKFSEVKDIETTTHCCPFFLNEKCSIHFCRPIDCRFYPLTPRFTKDSFEIKLLKCCPYGDHISKKFVDQISAVSKKLLPFLSSNWKQKYNKIIANLPLKDLPLHLQ